MKTLLVSINKGGVGKSMISCQLARYAHGKGLRVLFVDLDDQGNSSNHLLRDQIAQPYSHSIAKILCQYGALTDSEKELGFFSGTNSICLVQADAMLVTTVVEQSQAESDDYEGLKKGDIFLENISAFTVCVQSLKMATKLHNNVELNGTTSKLSTSLRLPT